MVRPEIRVQILERAAQNGRAHGRRFLSFNASDTTWSSRGDLPAAVRGYVNHSFPNNSIEFDVEYSDDYYAALKDSLPSDFQFFLNDSVSAVSIGRIPCDSVSQCERYVQKVIDFENSKRLNKSWFNSAMVVSDDTMQVWMVDPLNFTHLEMAEECAELFASFVVCHQNRRLRPMSRTAATFQTES
jgi:hypothetical protein